jgi:hypothetical protein
MCAPSCPAVASQGEQAALAAEWMSNERSRVAEATWTCPDLVDSPSHDNAAAASLATEYTAPGLLADQSDAVGKLSGARPVDARASTMSAISERHVTTLGLRIRSVTGACRWEAQVCQTRRSGLMSVVSS